MRLARGPMGPGLLRYVDDTCTLARDLRQADRRLWMFCYVCTKCGLWLNVAKCHTHVQAADLLGNTRGVDKT